MKVLCKKWQFSCCSDIFWLLLSYAKPKPSPCVKGREDARSASLKEGLTLPSAPARSGPSLLCMGTAGTHWSGT